MQIYEVTDDISIEAMGPEEAQTPILHIVFDDYPEAQTVPVFADEIKRLVAALTEAAVWLVSQNIEVRE